MFSYPIAQGTYVHVVGMSDMGPSMGSKEETCSCRPAGAIPLLRQVAVQNGTRACIWKLSTRRHGSDVRQVLRRWILVAERRGRNIVEDARCSAANVNGVQSSCVSPTVSCSGGIDAASDRRMTARRWLWNTSGQGARGVRPAVRFDVLAGTHE